jgi:hypothetical protein
MLSITMLSVVMLCILLCCVLLCCVFCYAVYSVMLSVVMLCVAMLSVFILNVVASLFLINKILIVTSSPATRVSPQKLNEKTDLVAFIDIYTFTRVETTIDI